MLPSEYIEKNGWNPDGWLTGTNTAVGMSLAIVYCMRDSCTKRPAENALIHKNHWNMHVYLHGLGTSISQAETSPAMTKELAILNLKQFGL